MPARPGARRRLRRAVDQSPDCAQELIDLVAARRGIASAVLDEHYILTAIVADRRRADATAQTVVIEFIDRGQSAGAQRWTAAVYDELRELATPLAEAGSAKDALDRLDWKQLDK